MGEKAKLGGSKVLTALKGLIGPIGFMAIAMAVASAAAKVAKFFDTIKQRCDEAVQQVQEIRAAYDSLFEAMDAFDEKSRQAVTKTTERLLQETGVTREIGLPVVDAYTRQFKSLVEEGRISQEQYTRGLKEMLGYAARHGGEATKDLIMIMSGWGEEKQYMAEVRKIGAERQKRLQIEEPVRQYFREKLQWGEAAEKEYAAYRQWEARLTEEERAEIRRLYGIQGRAEGRIPERIYWERMTAREKYEALIRIPSVEPEMSPISVTAIPSEEKVVHQTINNYSYHFSHDLHYHPMVGGDESGPRVLPGVVH
jgi:hypothetical protein